MKILILSDTHRNRDRLKRVLALHPDADAILHLGDGYSDFSGIDTGDIPLYRVRGNCDDLFGNSSDEEVIELGGVRILMMHGHYHSVKSGISRAAAYAVSKNVDVLLFGHTHVPVELYIGEGERVGTSLTEKPMWIFNPGSLGRPPLGERPSFGLLTIRDGQILLSHGKTD